MPTKPDLSQFLVAMLVAAAACGGGSHSKNSPVGPSGGPAAGTWTGTLTRPGGLAPMSVQWQAMSDGSYTLAGPMTLTNGATSVTITAKGITAGNDQQGYTIFMQLTSKAGDIAAFPNCTVLGNTPGGGQGDPFPTPYSAITVPAFDLSYNACTGFVEANFVRETVAVTLRKQ